MPPLLPSRSVVVHECLRRLLVAERERGRVHAFNLDGTYEGKQRCSRCVTLSRWLQHGN